MGDAFNNFVMDPAKDMAIDSAADAVGMGDAVNEYNNMSNEAFQSVGMITRTGRFVYENFFN